MGKTLKETIVGRAAIVTEQEKAASEAAIEGA